MIKVKQSEYFKLLDRVRYFSPEIYFNSKNTNRLEVFIYASGKTASTSIFESFKSLEKNCIHMHSTKYYINYILKIQMYENFKMFDYINYLSNIEKSNILIIDIFREPIARKISAFFQHFNRFNYKEYAFNSFEEMQNYFENNIDELITIFNDNFLTSKENYYAFDEYTEDNVYIRNMKFNHAKKRIHFKHNNKKYLVIRFDDIKKWNEIFRDIGYNHFDLVSANTTESKSIAELNKIFKDNYFIPEKSLNYIYKDKHKVELNLFYTKKELNSKYEYWLTKST